MYIAHIRKEDGTEQLLKDHLREVQIICENIGEKFSMPSLFGLAGLLHDLGKYSDEFQIYLREAYFNPTDPPKRGSVNHSTAGGKLLMSKYEGQKGFTPVMIEMIANAIYSHHGQLHDFVNLDGESPFFNRANNDLIPIHLIKQRFFEEVISESEFEAYFQQASKEFHNYLKMHFKKPDLNLIYYKLAPQLTLTIFSSLIDADRTNSRDFDENIPQQKKANITDKFTTYLTHLEKNLQLIQQKALPNEISKLRQKMSNNCFEKAVLPTGVYSLSIPTGGGKTLASLRFALKHAIKHGMDRIIYVVPFTTIIEQNAQSVREILNTEEVLEFHSNIIDERRNASTYEEMSLQRQINHAKDNWDMPIVFTTMVQYLNSFYSGKGRNLRRLHNLSNAVVIFDEVQSVPIKCISLFNETVNYLTEYAHSTVLLCTATQPALKHVKQRIQVDAEIIENLQAIEKAFKRTNIVYLDEKEQWTTDDLVQFIAEKFEDVNSVLVITNNKKTTKELYTKCQQYEYVYHLSTGMCPEHRKEILADMRKKIEEKKQIFCVSTQLIEAGVDVSFDCVMRSLAGVDSIAQSAGRCNRNGEVVIRDVYVFKYAEESLKRLPTIEKGQRLAQSLIRDIKERDIFGGELLSSQAIELYFRRFYEELALELDFPIRGLEKSLYELIFTKNTWQAKGVPVRLQSSFRTVADYFEVIEANTESILVPYGEGKNLIVSLTSEERVDYKVFMKQAQQYSVNVFPQELRILQQENLIRKVDFGVFQLWIALDSAYDEQYGLSIKGEAKLDLFTF